MFEKNVFWYKFRYKMQKNIAYIQIETRYSLICYVLVGEYHEKIGPKVQVFVEIGYFSV